MNFIKCFFKDLWVVFKAFWEMAAYVFVIVCVFWLLFGWRVWLADGDVKCMFANDPAVCSAVKNK